MMIEQVEVSGRPDLLPDLQKVRAAGRLMLDLIDEKFDTNRLSDSSSEPPTVHKKSEHSLDVLALGSAEGLILVVDDIEANRDVLSRRLELQGFGVATAADGPTALSMLRENSFDLVLLDILMPVMDGYEVLEQLKADPGLKHLPVIMISAVSELDSVVRCIELGADDYIAKPFNPILLKARVSASMGKKRAHDRELAFLAELQQNYGRLQNLEHLRDDLTNMIVHDLRNPLTSMISGMMTLAAIGPLNDIQSEMMGIALAGGDALLGLINELLDVERMESGSMPLAYAKLNPTSLVEYAINQLTPLYQAKQQKVSARVSVDLPEFQGDESKLRRVLGNLLGNAIKFTPSGGSITVSASYSQGNRGLLFCVNDTGVGIPEEAFSRIFEKFGQVESRRVDSSMSSGLGLTFCKLAVEAHGGIIEVESEPGKGSIFSFTIPLLDSR